MSDHEHAQPRRRRWGLILFTSLLLLIGILVLMHWAWGSGGQKRLAKQAAAYKAAGEPIEPGDFARREPLSDEDNGAIDLRDAFKSIDQTTEIYKNYEKQNLEIPLTGKEIAAAAAAIDANGKAFEGIDNAMKRKGVDWRIVVSTPAINVLLPHLNEVRELATLVNTRAMLRYQDGDHAGALADMKRVRFLADAVEEPPQVLVTHLVGIGCNAIVSNQVQRMAPELKIGGDAKSATPQQTAELIALLLDDARQKENARMGMLGERMFQYDTARALADGTLSLQNLTSPRAATATNSALVATVGYVARPIALEDGLIMIRHTTAVAKTAMESPDWQTYKAKVPVMPPEKMNPIRHVVLAILLPSFERAALTDYRSTGERRTAAAALAIRWYAHEHDGKLPEKLADLVPKYLPAVPMDPYVPNQPIKYIPDVSRPILYLAGENGVDDGGSEAATVSRANPGKYERLDVVTHLKKQPRESVPVEKLDEESIYPEETTEPPATEPTTTQSALPAPATSAQ
jgi:hypothetical protein